MADYGFRISKGGVDVKTGDDEDMVITSKYACLKGSLAGSYSGTATDGTTTTFTILTHSLGYIPMFQVNVNYNSEGYYRLLPTQIEINFCCWAYTDTTKLYVKAYNGTGSNKSVVFQYFIFLDKGKL
jgi:hypothetical protein